MRTPQKDASRVTRAELARLAGKTGWAVSKQLRRHGVAISADGTADRAAALEAMAAGAALDKARAESDAPAAGAGGGSVVVRTKLEQLRRIRLQADILEIERDKAQGKLVPVEHFREQVQAVAKLMLTWWDQAAEAAATKIKDASVLQALREARDRASRDILDTF